MEVHRSFGAGALCIALCLVTVANSAPQHYLTMAPGYPGVYQQQLRYQQPLYYIPEVSSSRTAARSPVGAGTSLRYLAVSHPEALPNQRYVITPYMSPAGFLPVAHSQVTALGPQGYQNNKQYLVYPAGTQNLRTDQRQLWQNIVSFVSGLPIFNRPNNEKPSEEEPGQSQGGSELAEEVTMGPGQGGSKPQASNSETPNAQPPVAEESNAEMAEPMVIGVVDPNVETIVSPNVEGAVASEMLSRLIARSRAFPRVDGENEEEVIEEEKEEEMEKEEEEEEEDSVVVGPGSTNPSVAQAKPAAIALAGVGGVAAAAPTATAVVGANGLAVAAPSATAVAGPSGGSPAGLLPKGTKVRPTKISPEEARINAAKIQAARQSAYDMIAGLRMGGISSLPILAYRV